MLNVAVSILFSQFPIEVVGLYDKFRIILKLFFIFITRYRMIIKFT